MVESFTILKRLAGKLAADKPLVANQCHAHPPARHLFYHWLMAIGRRLERERKSQIRGHEALGSAILANFACSPVVAGLANLAQ